MLLVTQLYNSMVMVYYEVNYDYYIEHCENKTLPQLHCDGKCILAQQLIQEEESSSPTEAPPMTEIQLRLFYQIEEYAHPSLLAFSVSNPWSLPHDATLPTDPYLEYFTPPPRF